MFHPRKHFWYFGLCVESIHDIEQETALEWKYAIVFPDLLPFVQRSYGGPVITFVECCDSLIMVNLVLAGIQVDQIIAKFLHVPLVVGDAVINTGIEECDDQKYAVPDYFCTCFQSQI